MRIFEVTVNEVVVDPDVASEKLAATLKRGGEYGSTVVGMCSDASTIYLSIVPAASAPAGELHYRFAPLTGAAAGTFDVESAIMARYYAGFTTVGSFAVGTEIWALFVRSPEDNSQ